MGIETRQPEEDRQEAFTFTPPPSAPPPPPAVAPAATPTAESKAETMAASPDWRELRRQERAARRAERQDADAGWIGGVVLMVLGGVFLLQNMGLIQGFANWWALFILIPAVGSFATAWRFYQQAGHQWTPTATGPLLDGLILTGVAAMFLFGLNIGQWWPVFLIAGGVATLLGARSWR
ncbi:MAG: hypothetical protein KF832_02200 [Caldilineaceae bacterium]|nr:hypothetical protein [Caldilineaceae bacterium]